MYQRDSGNRIFHQQRCLLDVKDLVLLLLCFLCFSTTELEAAVYQVGSDQEYHQVENVPWEKLMAGDEVHIHWRPQPYQTKWVLCCRGTKDKPIVIKGIPSPKGELPVIDGRRAMTCPQLRYWGEQRGIIKIGGARDPADTMPAYIIIENLDIRSARPSFFYFNSEGLQKYFQNAAAIFIEKGEHITIRNCFLHDCGNGLFVAYDTKELLVENCAIYHNGIAGSLYEHNVYTEAAGITFEGNYLGPLRKRCLGNNLKDRSAGLVVRYNWIEGGNRQLDLVDSEGGDTIRYDPRYRTTYVYGNVLVKQNEDPNSQMIHYGGDSGDEDAYRKGTLFLFNNTVVSRRASTTLVRLSTNGEHLDCRNNILYTSQAGSSFAILDELGTASLSFNWLKKGWKTAHSRRTGNVDSEAEIYSENDPGFQNAEKNLFFLTPKSACLNKSGSLPKTIQNNFPIKKQFHGPRGTKIRPTDSLKDLGALGRQSEKKKISN
ncbi:MAG: right-handed parallel beta-helix repeat-containing protein [Planctomycetes bacterium]|nr:right-handed parallel beta-helix repeat-containing protein [Planctomycetota bacterium]MCH9724495.1 right-handed parallel beta-helix repeat-containing protein [Planctomycetota bacterium]MCH9774846.1 right-handed parallel beta-helix repeat-containing protein [Planctomycetota bacterium]